MRGAATKSMSDIVEERQQSRCPPAAAPLRAAARRPAGFVARSSHTAPGIARRSRLASGPGGQQQSVHIISSQTLALTQEPKGDNAQDPGRRGMAVPAMSAVESCPDGRDARATLALPEPATTADKVWCPLNRSRRGS